jgi:hypothetical protein
MRGFSNLPTGARVGWLSGGLSLTLFLSLSIAGISAAGTGFQLITPEDYKKEQAARAVATADYLSEGDVLERQTWTRSLDAPVIEVVTPDATSPVRPPVNIEVRFQPGPGAKIVKESLRIKYGLVGLDITERIRKAATVTEQGIRASGAELPAGSHSLSIEIADTAGRRARQVLKFRVDG